MSSSEEKELLEVANKMYDALEWTAGDGDWEHSIKGLLDEK